MLSPAVMMMLYVALAVTLTAFVVLRAVKWWRRRQQTAVATGSAVRDDAYFAAVENRASINNASITTASTGNDAAINQDTAHASSAVGRTDTATAARPVSWTSRRLLVPAGNGESLLGETDLDLPARRGDYALGSLTPSLAALLPESEESRRQWREELRTAGYLGPKAGQNFAATRYLLVIVPMLLMGVLLLLVPPRMELFVIGALVMLPLLGWALPALHVRSRKAARIAEIERGMPDLIDMLNMCVSQGLTIPAALRRIRPQIVEPYPALGTELGIVIEQAEMGSLRHALENFARRIDVPDVRSFVNLLTQTDRMGTSVSQALTTHSDGVRENLRQRADEKANRASFRLLFPTVLCLMPAVYLILLGPAVNEMNRFFSGEGASLMERTQATIREIEAPQLVLPEE